MAGSTHPPDTACLGMTEAIYAQMQSKLGPKLLEALAPLKQLPEDIRPDIAAEVSKAEANWHALAQSIATGVTQYLTDHMKIVGIETTVDISAPVSGSTGDPTSAGATHQHPISLSAIQHTTFTQSDEGTGHIAWHA